MSEWLAYALVNGLPESRAELRSGQLLSLVANLMRSKGARAFTPVDFAIQSPLIAEVEAEDAEPEAPQPFDPIARSDALAKLFGLKDES